MYSLVGYPPPNMNILRAGLSYLGVTRLFFWAGWGRSGGNETMCLVCSTHLLTIRSCVYTFETGYVLCFSSLAWCGLGGGRVGSVMDLMRCVGVGVGVGGGGVLFSECVWVCASRVCLPWSLDDSRRTHSIPFESTEYYFCCCFCLFL